MKFIVPLHSEKAIVELPNFVDGALIKLCKRGHTLFSL